MMESDLQRFIRDRSLSINLHSRPAGFPTPTFPALFIPVYRSRRERANQGAFHVPPQRSADPRHHQPQHPRRRGPPGHPRRGPAPRQGHPDRPAPRRPRGRDPAFHRAGQRQEVRGRR